MNVCNVCKILKIQKLLMRKQGKKLILSNSFKKYENACKYLSADFNKSTILFEFIIPGEMNLINSLISVVNEG